LDLSAAQIRSLTRC